MKQKYDSYKPSGIDWIGDIPSHWKRVRLKYIGESRNGLTYSPNDVCAAGKLVIRSSNIQNSKLCFDDCVYVHHYPSMLSINKGDTIICSRNGSVKLIGKSIYIEKDSDMTFGAFMMRFRPTQFPKFTHYLLNYTISNYKGLFATTTINQLTADAINKMETVIPPFAEQEAIAAWLDKKCEEIDAAIAKVDREIELIDELKQSEISRVVTRGLNPDAVLRPSGIDWINEIPFNWSSMKLKHTVKNIETDFMDGDWIESNDIATEGIRYLTSGNIGAGFYKEQGEGFITEETFAKLGCIEVFPEDLLISRLNEPIARTCFIPALGYRIVTCVDNVIYRPKSEQFDKRYMMYQLNSKPFWLNASQLSSGATMQRISRSKLGAIKVIVPLLSEQYAIADYLDKKCAEIDGLKAKLIKKRETHTELRQSIISEVVTGKCKVI